MAPKTRQQNYWTEPCNTPGPGPGAYKLPSTVGYNGHDSSRWRYPSYSLGERVNLRHKSQTPGPIYNVFGLNRLGKKQCQPGCSITSPTSTLKIDLTPGPADYAPEKYPHPSKRNAPAFSLRARTVVNPTFNNPGPNQYVLPSTIGGRIPNMKSAPCAYLSGRIERKDVMNSPGPAGYGVPNYQAVMYNSPKVYINGRYSIKESNKSPGPQAYYPTYNTGPNSPSYTMRSLVGRCVQPLITSEDLCE